MAIPEAQLSTWAQHIASQGSVDTHSSIKEALKRYRWPGGMNYTTYLQGSYGNDTNIRGNSDVDLVVESDSVFYNNLTENDKQILGLTPGRFKWQEFRDEVVAALTNTYATGTVNPLKENSVKVAGKGNRLPADVVVAVEYRLYDRLSLQATGITFWTLSGRQVINYPKSHKQNGVNKHSDQRTQKRYKPTVRMFKNARDRLVTEGIASSDQYPSYFIECLLYNVPDNKFGISLQSTYYEVIEWLAESFTSTRHIDFICQNGHQKLFGTDSTQWTIEEARDFIIKLFQLWNRWD